MPFEFLGHCSKCGHDWDALVYHESVGDIDRGIVNRCPLGRWTLAQFSVRSAATRRGISSKFIATSFYYQRRTFDVCMDVPAVWEK